jgi:hypothetical protein
VDGGGSLANLPEWLPKIKNHTLKRKKQKTSPRKKKKKKKMGCCRSRSGAWLWDDVGDDDLDLAKETRATDGRKRRKNPLVFLDIAIDGRFAGRLYASTDSFFFFVFFFLIFLGVFFSVPSCRSQVNPRCSFLHRWQ